VVPGFHDSYAQQHSVPADGWVVRKGYGCFAEAPPD
jgi:hypothetical protein